MHTTKQHHRSHRRMAASGITLAERSGLSNREGLRRSRREQIERAADVQRSLLPDFSGSFGGYRLASAYHPCETLGGDFYDIFRHPDCVTLMVSDAMGHGAEAALLTMLLKAVFQETAPGISDPGELLTEMNDRFHRLIPVGVFAATAVVRLDPNSSEVQLSNAGMPYPFVLRASTQRVDELRVSGVPLGMFDNGDSQAYGICRLNLERGDVLLISSDGIGSIEDDAGRCFEDCRLRRALSGLTGMAGDTVIHSLEAEAAEFSNGLPYPDDINLVAVARDYHPQRH